MSDLTTVNYKSGIPLFDGTNFNNWRFRIEMALDEKDLSKYIKDSLIDIITAATDTATHDKIKKDEKICKNIIVQSVHDSQLEIIKGKISAKDMIDSLAGIYERKSISSQLTTRRQLLTMKYSESDDISEHFLNFDRKIRDLKSSGAKIEDLDMVCHLLITLPKSYDNLVTAIETMDQSKITLDFVKSRLLDEQNKRKSVISSGKVVSAAMHTNVTCYGCGQVGHIKSQCMNKKKTKGKQKFVKKNSTVKKWCKSF